MKPAVNQHTHTPYVHTTQNYSLALCSHYVSLSSIALHPAILYFTAMSTTSGACIQGGRVAGHKGGYGVVRYYTG